MEAMACARPVIGSAVGGLQFSVEDGVTGILVPPRNPGALAGAIATLRANPARARAMGEAGLERARRRFTWEGVALQLAAVFEGAAGRAPEVRLPAAVADRTAGTGAADVRPSFVAPVQKGLPDIFLDKDGTLVKDVPYNVNPALLNFTPHAIEGLRLWRDAGYRLVVVTNQPGVGRGLFTADALARLHQALAERLERAQVTIDGFFACLHLPEDGCDCRKPRPGLILEAARMLDIDLGRSWMVGDILNDVEAGHRAGCRSVLLDVGHETEWLPGPLRTPEHRCTDLLQAARATLHPAAPLLSHGSRGAGVGAAA